MTQQPQSYGDEAYQPAGMTPSQERSWATTTHVVALAAMVLSAGLLGFVVSLVIYFMYRERGPFVRQHAANSVNIQIMTGIYLVISGLLIPLLIGLALWPMVLVWSFVLHVLAAMRANRGEWYQPPLTPRFVR